MAQPTYIARKGYDVDFAALTVDSLVVNGATIEAGAIVLGDDEKITAGASSDVTLEWDTAATPDQLQLACVADDTVFAIGVPAATQKSFDVRWYGNEDNGASLVTFDASANQIITTDVDMQFVDNDILIFGSGAGAGGDVQLVFDGTNMLVAAVADDTLIEIGDSATPQLSFDVKVYGNEAAGASYLLWDASDSALEVTGDARLDFSGATARAAWTDGAIIKAGTSAARIVEDTANMKFVSMYFDDGATSGHSVGIYDRLYVTGAGGSGTGLRVFTTVEDVAGATAHGAQISLSLGASGSLTGMGIGVRSQLNLPTTALPASNVSYAPLQAEIYSDGDDSDPSGNLLSLIRLVNDGTANGKADVDDDAAALDFVGFTVGDGNMIAVKAAAAAPNVTHSIRIRLPDGTAAYLYAGPTALTA
jgi:hypothetical protein